jgi:hypothetical protein
MDIRIHNDVVTKLWRIKIGEKANGWTKIVGEDLILGVNELSQLVITDDGTRFWSANCIYSATDDAATFFTDDENKVIFKQVYRHTKAITYYE